MPLWLAFDEDVIEFRATVGCGHHWTTTPSAIDVDALEKPDRWSSHIALVTDTTTKGDVSLMNFVMTTRLSARFRK
jgi:hypothetical protein